MKIKQLFLFSIMLVMLSLLLTACELPFDLPFDIPFLGGEETTTTTEAITTTEPTAAATTTTGVVVTLPPVTAAPNPIIEVRKVNSSTTTGLRLVHKKGTTMIEDKLAPAVGRNGVSYTYTFDKDSGVLTMTLYDAVCENLALIQLGEELPAPLTVKIRENNKNLEWAYADGDTWTVLCKATDTNAKPLADLCEATGFATTEAPTEAGVTFVISGNMLRFRARMWQNEGKDICTDAWLHNPGVTDNNNFMQRYLYEIDSATPDASMEAGTLFKTATDEIPSIFMNGTYIAAKHGYYVISSVPNSAGFTEKDIGLVFTREADGQKYVLVKVPDNKAWFCPFDEAVMESGDFTKYAYSMTGALKAGNELTYTVGGKPKTVIISADSTHEQFRSSTNHCIQHAYLNGTVEVDLTKDGVYNADFVDFYERYSVIHLPTVLEHLMDNVGKNTNTSCNDESLDNHYLSFIQVHRFHKNGSFTMYQKVEFHRDLTGVYYFGVISEAFSVNDQYVYAPGATNCGTPTLHTKGTGTFYAQGDATIRSFFQFADAGCEKGMNVGYYPYFEVATDEVRPEMLQRHRGIGEWSNIGKMYPYLYNVPSVSAGDSFSFIGYHVPTIRFDDDFFAVNWYFVGDEIYLSMHTDKAVAEKTVALPNADYLIGLTITVDEVSDGFTVLSDTVTADGIRVSTTGAGYVTLKLTK